MSFAEAVEAVKAFKDAKFPERVELHLKLAPPRKGQSPLRGSLLLPHAHGKEVRVICFAEGDAASAAENAGAVAVGGADLAERVSAGWSEFDAVVAHPSAMRHVGQLGKVLKQRMPSPTSGSITPDVARAVEEIRTRRVRYREDDGRNVHVAFGAKAAPVDELVANLTTLLDHLRELAPGRPTRATIKATMSRAVVLTI